jgi:membrane fusion protein (multidrug efflux system)
MQRRSIALGLVFLAAVGLLAWMSGVGRVPRQSGSAANVKQANPVEPSGKARNTKGSTAAVAVEAATVRSATATTDIRAIGSLSSDESVQITSEIAGRVAEIKFTEGGTVNAGDVLVKLDDALAQAESADAQARFDLAESNNSRAKTLSRTGNVTEKAIDEAAAAFEIARAALELQKVKLAKHTIAAPFAGRLGLRKVSPGGFIAVATPIVNLEKIDILKVDFKLPELFLANLSIGQTVDVTVDALPGRVFAGEVYAIDPQVDVNGRAMQLRARIANSDFVLRPGLFARILVRGKQSREVILVPESAIVPRGGETFVFKIETGNAVEAKVKLGERRGAEVEVLEGLTPATQVVTAGQLKLRNNIPVEVVPTSATPASNATPTPATIPAAKKDRS